MLYEVFADTPSNTCGSSPIYLLFRRHVEVSFRKGELIAGITSLNISIGIESLNQHTLILYYISINNVGVASESTKVSCNKNSLK